MPDGPNHKPWPADRPERRALASLRPFPRNARTHSEAQIAQVAASIREWGWTNAVLIDESGEIIAGHARVLAARQLGITEAPCIVARGWSEAQKRAYVIADNKLALNAGWDDALLRLEVDDLRSMEFDVGLTGFSRLEFDRLFAKANLKAGLTDPDAAGSLPVAARSRRGEVWICGDHRVMCGDATSAADMAMLMASERAVAAFTDPPYGVDYGAAGRSMRADVLIREGRAKHRPIINDSPGQGFEALLRNACSTLLQFTDGAVYICMSTWEFDTLQRQFKAANGKLSTVIIWAKDRFTLGRSDYQRQFEPILYGWREGATRFWCGDRNQGDVWLVDRPAANDLHPTMKPVALVERALQNSSPPDGIVLDPFGGSGTTMIAAEQTGRRARLMELDPLYVDVIVERWQSFTGGKARRLTDDVLFEVIDETRNQADAVGAA